MDDVVIAHRFQGPTGQGQGGYTAGRLAEGMPGPVRADLHTPIPLDATLRVSGDDRARTLVDGDTVVMRATAVDETIRATSPVSLDQAASAAGQFPGHAAHPVPDCYSCGLGADSLRVWPGPVDDDLFATVWTAPEWTCRDGAVETPHVWAILDCPAGWRAMHRSGVAAAVTAVMTAHILEPVVEGQAYVLTAWSDGWRRRRCTAGASMFTEDGRLVAHQASMWVAIA